MEVRTFEGKDIEAAVAAAASELGLSLEQLQYEVADPGAKGLLGVGGRPARIVVRIPEKAPTASELEQEIERFQVEALQRMGVSLEVTVDSDGDYLFVRLSGRDRDLVLQNRAEVMEAFQYLLNRIFGKRLGRGSRIVVDCEGFRHRKEEELRQIARKLCEKVKLTGMSQELGPMNPYERRIVHLAIAEEGGVTSVSSGEGFLKRITIAPRDG